MPNSISQARDNRLNTSKRCADMTPEKVEQTRQKKRAYYLAHERASGLDTRR
jgi:hypothetical protein